MILIDSATGGTAMTPAADIGNGYWGGAGGGLREAAISDLNACIAYLRGAGYAYQFGGILWSQGERDAQSIEAATITKADYTSAWADFIAYMRGELGDYWPLVFHEQGLGTVATLLDFKILEMRRIRFVRLISLC